MQPIKIGIVGLGRAGKGMHTSDLRKRSDKFKIHAICDIIEERCDPYMEEFGSRKYTRIEELIADPQVEIVDIATRSCDHFIHAKMALKAGKSVFLEKPFCTTLSQARELIELGSVPAGPRLFIRHNRRFETGFMKVQEIIDSGILGKVFEIKLTRNGYQRRADWQTIKEFGGGQLLNWGPHIIDHSLRFCAGRYDVLYSNIKRTAAVGDAEDHIKIVFTGANGRIVDMEISGGAALPTPEYMIYGTRGSLVSEGQNLKLKYLDPKVELPCRTADRETPAGASFAAQETLPWVEETVSIEGDKTSTIWDALYDSFRTGKAFPITLQQAADVVGVIEKVKKGTIYE